MRASLGNFDVVTQEVPNGRAESTLQVEPAETRVGLGSQTSPDGADSSDVPTKVLEGVAPL